MQEFNQDHQLLTSNANAVNFAQENQGVSAINPPILFAEPSIQLKEEELSQEASEIASPDIENNTPTPVVAQSKMADLEEEEGQSETQLKLDYSAGAFPPPSKPNNNNNSASVTAPFQMKKENTPSSKKSTDSGNVMSKMESSFGADFSNIQINANSSDAKSMGALAFAKGNQIDFAPGQYNPESQAGQELLGHELTHVVQQREGRVSPTKNINGASVNDDPSLEKEADISGSMAAKGIMQNKVSPQANSISNNHVSFDLQTSPVQRKTGHEDTTPVDVDEEGIAKDLISKGAKNENYITDEVFYKRYPGIHRRKLVFPNSSDAETALVRDWMRIRNDVVRPILAGEEIPDKDKPENDKPGEGGPEKGKPKKDKPEKEDPKKDKPKKDDPIGIDPVQVLPDIIGITPETFNLGLDATKAICEVLRLIPVVGVVTGGVAGLIQTYQDIMTSIQTGDAIIGITTLMRNTINLVNGLIGDISYIITALEDLSIVLTALGFTATGPLGFLVAGVSASIVACNEAISIVNLIGDYLLLCMDSFIIGYTSAKIAVAPLSKDELAAHKSLLVGYIGNAAADLISFIADLADSCSGGLLQGELAEKSLKGIKGVVMLIRYGTIILSKLDGILSGIIIPGEINLLQAKSDGDELEADESGLEEILGSFVLANQKFESLDGGAKALLDMWPTLVEQIEGKIAEMSDGREPFEVAKEMLDQALAEMEMKISSMTLIQDQLESADNNILIGLEEIENIESIIEELSIPEIELADIDLGDNLIADGIEGLLEGGADVVSETLNKAIRLANQEMEKMKDSLRAGIAGFKEELEFYRVVIEETQKVLSGHKEELRTFIDSTREQLAECGSFEDLFNGLLSEMGKLLGLEEEIDVDTLRAEWDETKTAVAEGLQTIKEYLAGKEGGATSVASSVASQMKSKDEIESVETASDSSGTIQKKGNENEHITSQEKTNTAQGPFHLKQESNSHIESSPEPSPFQLKQNENLNSMKKKKEYDLPFAL